MRKTLVLFLVFSLAGCGQDEYGDLREFVKNSGANLRGRVEPLPEVKSYEPFSYNDFELTDPFNPKKLEIARIGKGGGLQPDLNRRKEPLESFPLEGLQMVGTIRQGDAFYALIKAPDNSLYRVTKGSHLGQNFGKVVEISEKMIKIQELVQDSNGDWTEKTSTLQLVD